MADVRGDQLARRGFSLNYNRLREFTDLCVVVASDKQSSSTIMSVEAYMHEVDGHMTSKFCTLN